MPGPGHLLGDVTVVVRGPGLMIEGNTVGIAGGPVPKNATDHETEIEAITEGTDPVKKNLKGQGLRPFYVCVI